MNPISSCVQAIIKELSAVEVRCVYAPNIQRVANLLVRIEELSQQLKEPEK